MNSILVPLDSSALAERALPYAQTMARLLGARIHLLQVITEHDPDLTILAGTSEGEEVPDLGIIP